MTNEQKATLDRLNAELDKVWAEPIMAVEVDNNFE